MTNVTTPNTIATAKTATTTTVNKTYKAPPVRTGNHVRSDQMSIKDWALPESEYAPSKLAFHIMGFRRQYGSKGIVNFASTWLEPTLKTIVRSLKERGYTVAEQIVGSTYGERNYCFDVSKDDKLSDVLYVAHYDTVDKDVSSYTRFTKPAATATATDSGKLVKHVTVVDGVAMLTFNHAHNFGAGCLGADDGAGLAVMLSLMNDGVLGGYCFTTGEECGGYGAEDVAKQATQFLKQYKKAIEIDRRGFQDIVCTQSAGECASIAFGEFLEKQLDLGMTVNHYGSYTDVSTFAEFIPECVNLSAGYTGAHTTDEQVSLPFLDVLAQQLKQVEWDKAPIKRTAGDYGDFGVDYGYGYNYYGGKYTAYKKPSNKTETTSTSDNVYESLDEKTINRALMLAIKEPVFADYLLSESIFTLSDLDIVCFDTLGDDFEEVCEKYNI